MAKDKEPKELKTRTARVVLDGGDIRLEMGEYTASKLEPGPTMADVADVAFKACRASLQKLMVQKYRIIVIEGDREEAYGLDRRVKLIDRSNPEYEPKKERTPQDGEGLNNPSGKNTVKRLCRLDPSKRLGREWRELPTCTTMLCMNDGGGK